MQYYGNHILSVCWENICYRLKGPNRVSFVQIFQIRPSLLVCTAQSFKNLPESDFTSEILTLSHVLTQ